MCAWRMGKETERLREGGSEGWKDRETEGRREGNTERLRNGETESEQSVMVGLIVGNNTY